MRVYISGKITGTTDFMERFDAAEDELNRQGHSVVNPARINAQMPKDTKYEDYMEVSFALLSTCDAIYMMKDWETSQGAIRELCCAVDNGITCIGFLGYEEAVHIRNRLLGQIKINDRRSERRSIN